MEKLITINCVPYYRDLYCKCGCGKRIRYPTTKSGLVNHKYRGIPKYIKGHTGYKFKKGHKINVGKNHPFYGKFGENAANFIDGFGREREIAIHNSIQRKYPIPIPLNDPFKNASFHHIDKEKGIFIPRKLHRSFYHSVKTGKNLEEMNDIATYWMFEQIDKELERMYDN